MLCVVNIVKKGNKIVAYDLVDEHEVSYTVSKDIVMGYVKRGEVRNAKVYQRDSKSTIRISGKYGKREGVPIDNEIRFDKTYYSADGLMIACDDLPKYLRRGFVKADDPIFAKDIDVYRAVGQVRDYVDVLLRYYIYKYIKSVDIWELSNFFGSRAITPLYLRKVFPKAYLAAGDLQSVELFVKASSYELFTDNCLDNAYVALDELLKQVSKERGISVYSLRCNGLGFYYAVSLSQKALLIDYCNMLHSMALCDPKVKLTYSGFYNKPQRVDTGELDLNILLNLGDIERYDYSFELGSRVSKYEFPYKSITIDISALASLYDVNCVPTEGTLGRLINVSFLVNRRGCSKEFYRVYEHFYIRLGGVKIDNIIG